MKFVFRFIAFVLTVLFIPLAFVGMCAVHAWKVTEEIIDKYIED